MAAGGDPNKLSVGPGVIYVGALSAVDPTTAASAIDASWRNIGYTEDGFELNMNSTWEDIEVAEELEPVKIFASKRTVEVSFKMAENTARNLKLVLNGGLDVSGTITSIEPPDLSEAQTRVKILYRTPESEATLGNGALYLFRQVVNTSTVSMMRKKAPQKSLIQVTFRCERPDAATKPWRVFVPTNQQV